jgi:hypothetical protein
MIGETSKLTLLIPPKANEKRPCLGHPYNSYRLVAEPRMSSFQSQKVLETPAYLATF